MAIVGTLMRSVAFCWSVMFTVKVQAICEVAPVTIWRNNNLTCLPRAVCVDVFTTTRDLLDGTQCEERRITHNCMCPGEAVCPFTEQTHALYASDAQIQFTCQPVCKLPYCANIRSMHAVSQTVEQNAPSFGGKTYTRVNCRCPGHHLQYKQSGNTVQSTGQRLNMKTKNYSMEYKCTPIASDVLPDPCEV